MNRQRQIQRLLRIYFPQQRDHAAWLLINAVGRWWLLLHGWKREYVVGTHRGLKMVDLAHPRLKIAIEADGTAYHTDVVKEFDRDEALARRGWTVRHYRYPLLKKDPKRVRREVRGLFMQKSFRHWWW